MATAAIPATRSTTLTGSITLLGRILFALIFLMAGPNHFLKATIAFAGSQGVPMPSFLVPVSGAIALLGAISIILGFRTRIGAWLIVLFLVGVTPALHNFWAVPDPMMHQIQMVMFMKNVSMMGGALLLSQLGPGPWSLDGRR